MTNEYDPNQEYKMPGDASGHDDFSVADEYRPETADEQIADYVEIEEAPKKQGLLSKLPAFSLQNKRLWLGVGVAIVLVVGATVMHKSNTPNVMAAADTKQATIKPDNADLLVMKQQINQRNAEMQQATTAMQSEFSGVKQQASDNKQSLLAMQQQMQQMQAAMQQVANNENQLNNELHVVTDKLTALTTKKAPVKAPKKVKKVVKPRVYILQAIDAGGDLAWLQDQDGANVTVRVGDNIPGDKGQRVASIDTVNGQVITSQGKVIGYKA